MLRRRRHETQVYPRFRCSNRWPGPRARSMTSAPSSRTSSRTPHRPSGWARTGDQASHPGLRSTYRYGHLATHGFSLTNLRNPQSMRRNGPPCCAAVWTCPPRTGRHPGFLSGLVFAGVNLPEKPPEETILTALEAAELDLSKVELVVLSACERAGAGWPAARACSASSAPSSSPGPGRSWPAYGRCRMRRRTSSCASRPTSLVGRAGVEGGGVAAGGTLDAGELEGAWHSGASRTTRTAVSHTTGPPSSSPATGGEKPVTVGKRTGKPSISCRVQSGNRDSSP